MVSVENNQITNLIGAEENIAYLNFNNNQLTSLKMAGLQERWVHLCWTIKATK